MGWPTSLTTRTVKGRFVTYPDGVPSRGEIRIVLPTPMQGPADDTFVTPFDVTIPFVNGLFAVVLPANDDPQWTPSYYRITVRTSMDSQLYCEDDRLTRSTVFRAGSEMRTKLVVPYNSTEDIDLADVWNLPPVTPGESYVLLASRGVAGGVATLDNDGYLTESQLPPSAGGAPDWADIQGKPGVFPHDEVTWTEVTGKPSVFPSLAPTFSDVTGKPDTYPPSTHAHVISDVTGLTTALSSKLPVANPEIVDGTFVVRKSDNSSAFRARSTGGAVDYDVGPGDLIVSHWTGEGFTGTQVPLQRWRGDGNTLIGRTAFSDSPYGDTYFVDGATGAAKFSNLEATGTLTGFGAKVLVLDSDDPIPGGTPAGTVIIRTA
jgi:hypothetical protein